MSKIVYQKDKRYGTTYAYRVGSEIDPETGRRKTTREYVGRVDPQTGDIVPKAKDGGRNRSALVVEDSDDGAGIIELRRKLEERSEEVARLKAAVARLRAEEVRLSARVRELEELNEDLLATFVAMDDMLKGVRERMPGS